MTFLGSTLAFHPDRVRIHKLLYFVHTRIWVSDTKTLAGLPLDRLLTTLLDETQTLEQFQRRLIQYAEQLNKSETYLRVANLIVEELRQQQPAQDYGSQRPVDRFKLRYAVMQSLNPFKVKVILLALWHEYQYPDTSFKASTVEQFSLDELLRKVMQCYPNLSLLEMGVEQIAPKIDWMERQEISQIAVTLTSILRPYLPPAAPMTAEMTGDAHGAQDKMCTLLMPSKRLQSSSMPQQS